MSYNILENKNIDLIKRIDHLMFIKNEDINQLSKKNETLIASNFNLSEDNKTIKMNNLFEIDELKNKIELAYKKHEEYLNEKEIIIDELK
jgi:hypothetical protein